LGKNGKYRCLAAGGGAKMAGERPAVVSKGWRGWWVAVGVENLDVREEEDGERVSGCTAAGKEMGEWKKNVT
jgi:hypothetical protein